MNIVGDFSDFNQLKDCRVIEGYLHIVNVSITDAEYKLLEFPLLTEITDYMIVLHTKGIKSLGKLFPNLSVIRGNYQMMKGYSFVVVENMHLEDIGLSKLNYIGRGAVRINSNQLLCYADTIDWSFIAPHSSHPFHYIQVYKFLQCHVMLITS